ncbi:MULTISPECIES: S8 family serine peptidase [Shewanella]|uniref:GlyGly-CTERM sorting domain-containing protein n=1 Tax=Shewanella marisflavi TaxID=260364 RepID=A0ABX5WT13_9GAMM|nr:MULTISPECIES: S8 family serine peptidase [Shewanella]QDF76291.1 GlyGly-CTERM sorting domain-containing protein [Shewanella marisflavi]
MKFNKCTLALCVSTAILSGALQAKTESIVAFGAEQAQSKGTYTFSLAQSEKDSGQQILDTQQVLKQQAELLAQIKTIDPQARFVGSTHLLANTITLEVQNSALAEIRKLDAIAQTFYGQQLQTAKQDPNNHQVMNTSTAEEISLMTPYMGKETAGKGASVAIISTGIDYTLPVFGGSGVYGEDNDPETPPPAGSYLEALENGAIEYSGFPTAVVKGGWDFSSENFGNDANPIDQNLSYESYNGWVYPTGQGTELASIVHQLAPGAELHAYKVYNVSENNGWVSASAPSMAKIVAALEHALDPNQDGDTSDHLDIALIEAAGAGAFFDIDGNSSPSLIQMLIERVSAQGMTVVTHAGDLAKYSLFGDAEAKHRNWISSEGSSTSAITVGAVNYADDGETLVIPEWAPMGPVRGSQALKPEIVTLSDNQTVAKISNPDETAPRLGSRSGALTSAARIAAAAAVIKSEFPGFGPAEIKAILANTANVNAILESDGMTPAELYAMGHGMENLENAVASPIVAWETNSYQPYVQFGMHEVGQSKTLHKRITLRNISDTTQTYQIAYKMNGEKAAHEALSFNMPESVNIPANSSVILPITITVDGNKLPQWPLMSTGDHTDANLKATELNGYISLTSESKPEINLGWMLKARHSTSITKRPNAIEFPSYLGYNPDLGQTEWDHLEWGHELYPDNEYGSINYRGYVASFVNNSDSATTFQAYPLLLQNKTLPEHLQNLSGHMIKAVGGAIFDDAQCSVTGKKLNIAVSLFDRADTALPNYYERGPRLFTFDLFYEAMVKENGWDNSFEGAYIWDDAQRVAQPFVALNDKGQPTTYVIDYTIPYDYSNPTGRYKESSLPTHFANNGKNVVSQICLEDMFHHELDSVEDFDQNFGFHIETDRHTGRDQYEPLVQFNPIKGGSYTVEQSCYLDWFSGEEVCSDIVFDRSVHVGFAAMEEGKSAGELDYQQTFTAQPGEEIYIASVGTAEMGGIGPIEAPKGFMVVSLNDDFMQVGYNSLMDDDGSVIAKAQAGQHFSVEENAEVGTVVGKIELDSQGFFTYPSTKYTPFELHITNTLVGTPFAINQETYELYVVNPDALDYENNREFEIKVTPKSGRDIGDTETLTVSVLDINDVAPQVNEDVAASLSVPELIFKSGSSANFTLDIAGLFNDLEGNSLSYEVEGTGFSALSISGTEITGQVENEGSHMLTIIASDGVHQVTHMLEVDASFEPESDGGSLGWMSLILGALALVRRRTSR